MAKVIINMKPIGKARPRVVRGHAFTPKATKDAEEQIRRTWESNIGEQLHGCLELNVTAQFNVPSSLTKKETQRRLFQVWHTQKPDMDNIIKLVADALNGTAYKDDSAIVKVSGQKMWGTKDFIIVDLNEV